jgi:hypothetical protein
MGVRGTELMVNVNSIADKEVTQVALLEGHVHLQGEDPSLQQDLLPGDHAVIVKNKNGIEHKDRKLTSEEIKSYQEYSAPEILRLLDPVTLANAEHESSTIKTQKEQIKTKETTKEIFLESSETPNKKSLKEKLEILNSIREKNLKK